MAKHQARSKVKAPRPTRPVAEPYTPESLWLALESGAPLPLTETEQSLNRLPAPRPTPPPVFLPPSTMDPISPPIIGPRTFLEEYSLPAENLSPGIPRIRANLYDIDPITLEPNWRAKRLANIPEPVQVKDIEYGVRKSARIPNWKTPPPPPEYAKVPGLIAANVDKTYRYVIEKSRIPYESLAPAQKKAMRNAVRMFRDCQLALNKWGYDLESVLPRETIARMNSQMEKGLKILANWMPEKYVVKAFVDPTRIRLITSEDAKRFGLNWRIAKTLAMPSKPVTGKLGAEELYSEGGIADQLRRIQVKADKIKTEALTRLSKYPIHKPVPVETLLTPDELKALGFLRAQAYEYAKSVEASPTRFSWSLSKVGKLAKHISPKGITGKVYKQAGEIMNTIGETMGPAATAQFAAQEQQRLDDLLRKNLITQEQYLAKKAMIPPPYRARGFAKPGVPVALSMALMLGLPILKYLYGQHAQPQKEPSYDGQTPPPQPSVTAA